MRGDALVVVLHGVPVLVRPLPPAVPLADLGAGADGLGLSDQSSTPQSVLASPCYRFSCCPQAPYGLVGWLEMEFLLFKELSEASGLKSRKAPAWRLDSLQLMVAGIMVGEGVGMGGVVGDEKMKWIAM